MVPPFTDVDNEPWLSQVSVRTDQERLLKERHSETADVNRKRVDTLGTLSAKPY